MQYHAPTQQFTIEQSAFRGVVLHLKYAIRHIRKTAGLPLTSHRHEGVVDEAYCAEAALLDAAREIGIHMGAERPGMLDVSHDS